MSRDDARPPRRPSPRRAARTPPATPIASIASTAPATQAAAGRTVSPRIRVRRGDEIALGPGKVALLEAIHAGGSLTAAARGLGMSYMRAWKLVQTMNACFREPLVTTHRGGKTHCSAVLTLTGERALALYRGMEEASREAMAASWRQLRVLLK